MKFYLNIESQNPVGQLSGLKKLRKLFATEVKKVLTVIKSPFVFKKSRNQISLTSYKSITAITLKKDILIISPAILEYFLFYIFQEKKSTFIKVSLLKSYTSSSF
jgi:hypothetical protein